MSVYQIPKENFQELYIFEGGLFHYDLTNIDSVSYTHLTLPTNREL